MAESNGKPTNGDGKATGWFRLANDLIDSTAWASLGPAAAKVLVVLARYADKDGVCFPGRKRIAEEAGIAVGSVTRTVLELQAVGLVTRQQRCTEYGDSDTNVYRLTLPTPQSGLITSAKTSSQQCEGGVISSVRGVLSGVRTKEDICEEDPQEGSKPSAIDLPFSSERFVQTWGDFLEHRRGLKPPLTDLAIKRTLAKCQAWGETAAIQALDASIENGWKGIFEPKANGNGKHRQPTAGDKFDETATYSSLGD